MEKECLYELLPTHPDKKNALCRIGMEANHGRECSMTLKCAFAHLVSLGIKVTVVMRSHILQPFNTWSGCAARLSVRKPWTNKTLVELQDFSEKGGVDGFDIVLEDGGGGLYNPFRPTGAWFLVYAGDDASVHIHLSSEEEKAGGTIVAYKNGVLAGEWVAGSADANFMLDFVDHCGVRSSQDEDKAREDTDRMVEVAHELLFDAPYSVSISCIPPVRQVLSLLKPFKHRFCDRLKTLDIAIDERSSDELLYFLHDVDRVLLGQMRNQMRTGACPLIMPICSAQWKRLCNVGTCLSSSASTFGVLAESNLAVPMDASDKEIALASAWYQIPITRLHSLPDLESFTTLHKLPEHGIASCTGVGKDGFVFSVRSTTLPTASLRILSLDDVKSRLAETQPTAVPAMRNDIYTFCPRLHRRLFSSSATGAESLECIFHELQMRRAEENTPFTVETVEGGRNLGVTGLCFLFTFCLYAFGIVAFVVLDEHETRVVIKCDGGTYFVRCHVTRVNAFDLVPVLAPRVSSCDQTIELKRGGHVEVYTSGGAWKTACITSIHIDVGKASLRYIMSDATGVIDLNKDRWRRLGNGGDSDVERSFRKVSGAKRTHDQA